MATKDNKKKDVPTLQIVEIYTKFEKATDKRLFAQVVAKNHNVSVDDANVAIDEISAVNPLTFEDINISKIIKKEDKIRLADAKEALKKMGYEAGEFYGLLFKAIKTDLPFEKFKKKINNAIFTSEKKTEKKTDSEKSVEKTLEKTSGLHQHQEKEEKMGPCHMDLIVDPDFLAEKIGIGAREIRRIIENTNLTATLNEKGLGISAMIPWNKL